MQDTFPGAISASPFLGPFTDSPEEERMPTQKFRVKGLGHEDEAQVARELRSLRGVLFAAADHSDQCAEVEFEDDAVTPDEIRERIEALGFTAEIAG